MRLSIIGCPPCGSWWSPTSPPIRPARREASSSATRSRRLRRAGVEVELLSFPRGRWNYPRAVPRIRRLLRRERFDLVHAHYGLAGWCASLAGARPLIVTFHGTDVRHPTVGRLSRRLARRLDLVAGASRALFAPEAERPGLPRRPGATAVLPCGADLDRFRPSPRAEARQRLGLDPEGRYLLFPAATFRPEKRHDRAVEVGAPGGRGAVDGRRDRGRADARLGQRRQRRAGHLGERGVRAGRRGGAGLRRAGALDPGRRRPGALRGIEGCLAEPFDPRPLGGARPRPSRLARSARRRAPAGPLVLGRADGRASPGRLSRGPRLRRRASRRSPMPTGQCRRWRSM